MGIVIGLVIGIVVASIFWLFVMAGTVTKFETVPKK